MSPLGSLGGLQLTLTIPDTLVLTAVTDLGDELGAASIHNTVPDRPPCKQAKFIKYEHTTSSMSPFSSYPTLKIFAQWSSDGN